MISIPIIIPVIGWLGAVIIGAFTAVTIIGVFSDPQKNKLGILGMQQAGKTRFLSFLRNIPFVEGSTGRDSYQQFKYKLSNGKAITIMPGKDIGGGESYRGDYNKIIEDTDVILYFFDIDRYLNNEADSNNISYQRFCNSRFEHIYSKNKDYKKPVIVIATHKDKCSFSESEMKQKFDGLIQKENKVYREMLKDVKYVNLTNNTEIKNLIDTIFK